MTVFKIVNHVIISTYIFKDVPSGWNPSIMEKIKGCAFCVLWVSSIAFGYWFLFAPLIPILFINRKVYRRTTDLIITAWESCTVSLLEIVFGVRTCVTGDAIRSEETSLIILNHPTRLDWGFLWCALLHSSVPPAHNAKFVLKDAVKNIPIIGKSFSLFLHLLMYHNRYFYFSITYK